MNSAAHIMSLDKLCGLYNIIRCNGGLAKLLRQLYRANDVPCADWIEEAVDSACCNTSEYSHLVNPEESCSFDASLMPAKLLKWMSCLTNDCFLLVPAKRLDSYEQDLQLLSKLHLNLSAPQIAPTLNIWDFVSVVLPPQTIEVTELFTSENSDGRPTHYYLAITKNNAEGSADSGDNIGGYPPRLISNSTFSNTAPDAIYSSNDRASLREILTNRNLSTRRPNSSSESNAMNQHASCTKKTDKKVNVGSFRKKHIDCSSELETEIRKPNKCIGMKVVSKESQKSAAKARTHVKPRKEQPKKLHMESKIGDDVEKAMQVSAEENMKDFMAYKRKENECNNMITDPNNKIINFSDKETNNLRNNTMHCSEPGRHSRNSDCKLKKRNISVQSTKDACGVQEKQIGCSEKKEGGCGEKKDSGCGEKKPSCGKKPSDDSGCGDSTKKSGTCGDSSGRDEGTCIPNMQRKEHPCDRDHPKSPHDHVDSHKQAKRKEQFNKKMKTIRIKYKIEHCRKSKIIWGRGDFSKKPRKSNDICSEK